MTIIIKGSSSESHVAFIFCLFSFLKSGTVSQSLFNVYNFDTFEDYRPDIL